MKRWFAVIVALQGAFLLGEWGYYEAQLNGGTEVVLRAQVHYSVDNYAVLTYDVEKVDLGRHGLRAEEGRTVYVGLSPGAPYANVASVWEERPTDPGGLAVVRARVVGEPLNAKAKLDLGLGRVYLPEASQREFYRRTNARPGAESRHNLTYWRYGDYAGIGPGAHGRLSRGIYKLATATERKPETWLELVEREGHGMIEQELLGCEEQADELLLMGLRLREGVDLARWQQLSGRDPNAKREEILLEHGFIERLGNSRLRCTPSGMLILDAVVADLAC